jgi:hypothetical protein
VRAAARSPNGGQSRVVAPKSFPVSGKNPPISGTKRKKQIGFPFEISMHSARRPYRDAMVFMRVPRRGGQRGI